MTIQLLAGDARDVLPTLAADSVHTVVTSPPYLGLRDYGTALWDGGDAACSHVAGNARGDTGGGTHNGNSVGFHGGSSNGATRQFRDTCGKCGARRIDRQIGLEATPDEYLATMVAVFREIRRVMRPDATCWVNMGDSYASTPSGSFDKGGRGSGALEGGGFRSNKAHSTIGHGAKPKDLLLMPARLALALQADGWWVRSDIIIAKKNPMPESARDRPTSAHEHVFLLTKNSRYFFDQDAVREPQAEGTIERFGNGNAARKPAVKQGGSERQCDTWRDPVGVLSAGRNIRNVWDISTEAFGGAHFATMPTSVVERCIRAGTSERGCCVACGAPWRRQIEKEFRPDPRSASPEKAADRPKPLDSSNGWNGLPRGATSATTTGWAPGCKCQANYDCSGLGCGHQPCICIGLKPCTVLDPFAGAGTTLLVADRLQRDAIGVELNAEYVAMTQQRIEDDAGLFSNVEEAPPQSDDSPSIPPENDSPYITLLDYLERAILSSDGELCDAR